MESLDAALDRALPDRISWSFQGAGPKAFSAGAEIADQLPSASAKCSPRFTPFFRRLSKAGCVKIAAVHGFCLGGGMELASFCDFVIATESAQFGSPNQAGCFPPVAMVTLPYSSECAPPPISSSPGAKSQRPKPSASAWSHVLS